MEREMSESYDLLVRLFPYFANFVGILLVMFLSKKGLTRLKKILDILTTGSYKDCPYYLVKRKGGQRWYDYQPSDEPEGEKGGESL